MDDQFGTYTLLVLLRTLIAARSSKLGLTVNGSRPHHTR
jgi:hypothetical protein